MISLLWIAYLPNAEADLELKVGSRLGNSEEEITFLNETLAPLFFDASGIRVSFEYSKDEMLLHGVKNKKKHESSYDLVILHESEARTWYEQKLVIDLTDLYQDLTDRRKRKFHSALERNSAFSGRKYFVPLLGDVYLTLARAQAFRYKKPGIRFQRLTWEQVVSWSQDIAMEKVGGKPIMPKPFAFAAVANTAMIYQSSSAILAFGGIPEKIDSIQAKRAWQTLTKLKQHMHPSSKISPYVAPLLADNIAWITIAHCARIGRVMRRHPGLFEVAPPPLSSPGGARGSVLGIHSIGIIAKSENQAAAKELIGFMTEPKIQVELARNLGGYIPSVVEANRIINSANKADLENPVDTVILSGMKLLALPPERVNFGYRMEASDRSKLKLVYDRVFDSLECTHRSQAEECKPVIDETLLHGQQLELDRLIK